MHASSPCFVRGCTKKTRSPYARYCGAHEKLWIANGWRDLYAKTPERGPDRIDVITRFEFHPEERPG